MVNYDFIYHATCLVALTTYKNNELQMSFTTQKLSYKASYKTPFFHIGMKETCLEYKPHLLKIAYYY